MYFLALALLSLVSAAVTPTSPDGSTVINAGSTLTALWDKDTTGTWQNTQIQLMTGDNFNMIALQTLATGVDGTSLTSWSGPCPNVTPNSKIYFLQFTKGGDVSTATWTTRFTIADASGQSTPPTNSTVYNGQAVQWGIGSLVGGAASNGTSSTNGTTTSGFTVQTSISSTTSSMVGNSTAAMSSASTTAMSSASTGASASKSSTSASTAPATASSKAAAGKVEAGLGMVLLGLMGAYLA